MPEKEIPNYDGVRCATTYQKVALLLAMSATASLGTLLVPSVEAAIPFNTEVVDTTPINTGPNRPSLVLDSQGAPHISYMFPGNPQKIMYAVKSGGNWVIETVEVGTGVRSSIALDTQNSPHISYEANGNLRYAVRTGGTWSIETVDSGVGTYSSIAIDGLDDPHIGYNGGGLLKYAVKSGGNWSVEAVDGGTSTSLALDGGGNPHIAYIGAFGLTYAVKSFGTWTIEKVDSTVACQHPSIALSTSGIHIAYRDGTNAALRYAKKGAGSWTVETVDGSGMVSFQTSDITVDSQNRPHIAYHAGPNPEFDHAVKQGGIWSFQDIDLGVNPVIAVDGLDEPHFASVKGAVGTPGELRYTAPAPICDIQPASLDFDTVLVGGTRDTTFTIENVGAGLLTGDVSESCSHYDILSGGGGYSLSAGKSRAVTVRFQPTTAGNHACTVETGDSVCIDVAATGTAELPPECDVQPLSHDFGIVTVGASTVIDFTVTNIGGGLLDGAVSEACSHYEIVSGGGSYSLSGGQSRTVTVRFAPTVAGVHLCTVETGSALCSDVTLEGTGEDPPVCDVQPMSIDFGQVSVGSSTDSVFSITNSGGGTVNGSVSATCTHFSIVSGGGAYSLSAGQSRVVTVRFEPTATGAHGCTVETGDTLCSDVDLTGTGFVPPECEVEPTSIDFDTLIVAATIDTMFTITNIGGGVLSGNVNEICSHYSIVSGGGAYALAGGQSVTVTVRFEPMSAGNHPCTVETGSTLCSDVALTGVAIPDTTDTDDDGVPDVDDNCPTVHNPSQADTDSIALAEGFEVNGFTDWSFASSTNGAQSGGICPGDWLSEIGGGGLLGYLSARLYARSDALCSPWAVAAAIERTIPTMSVLRVKLRFDSIQGGGGTGHSYFDITAINAQNTSQRVTYRFATTTDLGGDFAFAVTPGQQLDFSTNVGQDFSNKFGMAVPGDVVVRFRVSADYAENAGGSKVRSADVMVDAIEVTGVVPDSVGDACDNCPSHYNPGQEDSDGKGMGDVCSAVVVAISPPVPTHDSWEIHPNIPNPFNPVTTISFTVPVGGAKVSLQVFDVHGRLVRTLVDEPVPVGTHRREWNGLSDSGGLVASGVYFCRLKSRGVIRTRKMVFLK